MLSGDQGCIAGGQRLLTDDPKDDAESAGLENEGPTKYGKPKRSNNVA